MEWNLLDQRTVDARSLNALKNSCLGLGTTGEASSWTRYAEPWASPGGRAR